MAEDRAFFRRKLELIKMYSLEYHKLYLHLFGKDVFSKKILLVVLGAFEKKCFDLHENKGLYLEFFKRSLLTC